MGDTTTVLSYVVINKHSISCDRLERTFDRHFTGSTSVREILKTMLA